MIWTKPIWLRREKCTVFEERCMLLHVIVVLNNFFNRWHLGLVIVKIPPVSKLHITIALFVKTSYHSLRPKLQSTIPFQEQIKSLVSLPEQNECISGYQTSFVLKHNLYSKQVSMKKKITWSRWITFEMANVSLAVKSQCERVYVLGTIRAYLSFSSPLNNTFSFEASNLAGGPNSRTAWQCKNWNLYI